MYGSHKIPQQRLPLSRKTKKWREECIDAFIDIFILNTNKKIRNFNM